MKTTDVFSYFIGADFLEDRLKSERELLEQVTGDEYALPTEAGLETAVKIYGGRLVNFVVYPLVVATRVTGLDYLYRKLTEK